MPQVKYVSTIIASITAGTVAAPNVTGTDISSYDDDKSRVVTGVIVGGNTAGLRARLVEAGGIKAEIDTTHFSAAQGPLAVNVTYPPGQYFHVDLANTTAGTVSNIPITIRYEVP